MRCKHLRHVFQWFLHCSRVTQRAYATSCLASLDDSPTPCTPGVRTIRRHGMGGRVCDEHRMVGRCRVDGGWPEGSDCLLHPADRSRLGLPGNLRRRSRSPILACGSRAASAKSLFPGDSCDPMRARAQSDSVPGRRSRPGTDRGDRRHSGWDGSGRRASAGGTCTYPAGRVRRDRFECAGRWGRRPGRDTACGLGRGGGPRAGFLGLSRRIFVYKRHVDPADLRHERNDSSQPRIQRDGRRVLVRWRSDPRVTNRVSWNHPDYCAVELLGGADSTCPGVAAITLPCSLDWAPQRQGPPSSAG